jgi:hypothetical protein
MGRGALLLVGSLAGLMACGGPDGSSPPRGATGPATPASSSTPGAIVDSRPDDFPCTRRCRAVLGSELADVANARDLVKHHLLPALQAAEVREALGPGGLSGVDGLALVGDLAEDLYLAAPALAELERPPLHDEADVEARYETEGHRWVEPGRVAFVQAWLQPGGGREAEEAARSAVGDFYERLRAGERPAKLQDALYSLNHEPLRAIPPGDPLYELVGAPVGAVAGPFSNGPPIVALVTASEPETRRPLEEVRAEIEAELVGEELERRRRSLAERAARRFPVALEPGYGATPLAGGRPVGRVGALPIDRHLVTATRSLQPQFRRSRDRAVFERLLVQHYAGPRTLAAEERERGVHEQETVASELARVRRMAEDRLVAPLWWGLVRQQGAADASRVRGWYDDHPDRWVVRGDVDVLIAVLHDSEPGTASAARPELELRADRGEFDRQLKAHGDGYTVKWEPGITVASGPVLYAAVEGLEPGEVSGATLLGRRTVLACPTRRTPDRVVPFGEAREQCAVRVAQEEAERRLADLHRQARELVPQGFEQAPPLPP